MSYLSRREEELIETKRSQALALRLLEVFTQESTPDLQRLNLLSTVWQSVDRNILRTLDGAQGKEGTAKLLCELIVWKALEYWLMEDGMPCGQTDAEILAEFKAKVAAAAEAKPVTSEPEPKPKQPEPVADKPRSKQETWGIISGKSPEQVAHLRDLRNQRQRRYRAKRKATAGSSSASP